MKSCRKVAEQLVPKPSVQQLKGMQRFKLGM